MKGIIYYALFYEKEEAPYTLDIFHIKKEVMKHTTLCNESEIKYIVHTFVHIDNPCVFRLHIKKEENMQTDQLFIFFRDNLPKNLSIKKIMGSEDHVYKIQKSDKLLVVVTEKKWEKIKQAPKAKHTADHLNGYILETIHNLSGKLPIMFSTQMKARDFLPNNLLLIYNSLHNQQSDIFPSIQQYMYKRMVYKIKHYPQSLITKICLSIPIEVVSVFLKHFVTILSVFYYMTGKYIYELTGEEYAATLNWEEGTFITNKDYSENKDVELICEINEPHLMTRWGTPNLCSVVGVDTGLLYYGLENIRQLDAKSLSIKGHMFISELLRSSKWYENRYAKMLNTKSDIERCAFVRTVCEAIFAGKIFSLNEVNKDGNLLDSRDLTEKLSDFTCIDAKQKMFINYCFEPLSKSSNLSGPDTGPVTIYAEYYLSAPNEGQRVVTNGFILHMKNILFGTYK